VRSATDQPQRVPVPQTAVSPPPMVATPDPRMNNPWFNPNAPMFNQPPWMFPPSPGNFDPRFPSIDPRLMQNFGQQDPRLLQSILPMQRSDWAEMILVFPDGSFQRTIRDFRAMVTNKSLKSIIDIRNNVTNSHRVWRQFLMDAPQSPQI
jgi:hypothetical protein